MIDLAIYGAGGFGREMLLMVQQINDHKKKWNVQGFFDDGKSKGDLVDHLPILGGINELNAVNTSLSVVVAVADPVLRKQIVSKITNPKIEFPVLIHPAAQIGSPENKFSRGTLITAGTIFTIGIHLDEFVIINLSATIGHDVSIGAFGSIMPGCHISGNVKIGEGVLLGSGAVVLQGITIGNWTKVGAGAVVNKEVPTHVTVIGVPAKRKP